MAALVSLEVAKRNLKVAGDEYNNDVDMAVQDANAIILRYLKSRAYRTGTISSSSVADPTVLTMSVAHDFLNGDSVAIVGDTSTPSLDGSHVISNVAATTFTIPVAVTVAGTGGAVTVSWTEATVPGNVRRAILLMTTHLFESRGDFATSWSGASSNEAAWTAVERLLVSYRDQALA